MRVASAVKKETGLRTVFHHHCAGYVETPAEIDMLLKLTDPSLLGLCIDTGHYRFGGGDPLTLLRQHAGRIWHVHFKDCHPELAQLNHARSAGITSPRCAMAFSANWARAKLTSPRSKPSWRRWATTAGSWWSRMCCPAWASRRNRRCATAITWQALACSR